MMRNMNRPQDTHFMVEQVQPVIKKIFCKHQEYPVHNHLVEFNEAVSVKIIEDHEVNGAETKINEAVDKEQVQDRGSVYPVIQSFNPVITQEDFDPDDEYVQRGADQQQYLFT